MLSAAIISLLLSASDPAAPETSNVDERPSDHPLVPWYVPRSASLGAFINREMFSPHIRLAWEWTIVDQPRNALIATMAFGTGLGANPQKPMTSHFQHVGLVGAAFRSDRQLLHWGFSAMFGAVWYRTFWQPNTFFSEDRVLPYAEGRLQGGIMVAPHVRIALYIGYAAPFIYTRGRPGNLFVGGFDFGVLVDWR